MSNTTQQDDNQQQDLQKVHTDTLVSMGFPIEQVQQALQSNNFDFTLALEHLLLSSENKQINQQQQQNIIQQKELEFKMVLVVNVGLEMRKGKICAQCAHAAIGVYRKILNSNNDQHKKWLRLWENTAEGKIALKVNGEDKMMKLKDEATKLGLPTYVVIDAGRTQIPSGSKTVLAIGPGPVNEIDKVTKQLKLL